MPNECVNHITITSTSESDIIQIQSDIKEQNIVPKQISKKGIRMDIITAWKPDFAWLETVHKKYPSCWIKNEWISEDGAAGVWIAHNSIKCMEWDDLSLEDEFYIFGE